MFSSDDPLLARVRTIALALPEADEKVSHGRPAFFTQKVFCYFGGSMRIDEEWVAHDAAIMVRPDPDDDPALRQDPRFWVPGGSASTSTTTRTGRRSPSSSTPRTA
jgi:hypothetical protein